MGNRQTPSNPAKAEKRDITSILNSLTLEEKWQRETASISEKDNYWAAARMAIRRADGCKISLLSGDGFWDTKAISGKLPKVKLSDGPNGVRGGAFHGTTPAACFPAATCLAATFDARLARSVGNALAEEAKDKTACCVLAPTICLHRHPLGGRNFESFSEDPFLSGKLASQIVQGLQDNGIAAAVKHYAGNEQETMRTRVDTIVSERALRELYLRSFEIVVKEAHPWAILTAYNLVNGEHCDSNSFLLKKVLRGDWQFDGMVISDWGGTNSTAEAIDAGLDLEMPGPTVFRKIPDVLKKIEDGTITEATIDERVHAYLSFLERVRAFDEPKDISVENAVDRPEHRKLIRKAASHGSVLLKNDRGILPLTEDKVRNKKIALLGLADTGLAHGGGSGAVLPHHIISPRQALQARIGQVAELLYAKGAYTNRFLPPLSQDGPYGQIRGEDGNPGWTQHTLDKEGHSVERTLHGVKLSLVAPFPGVGYQRSLEYVCIFSPRETGRYYLGVSGVGPTKLFVNDELLAEQIGPLADPMGFIFNLQEDMETKYHLESGSSYKIRIRSEPNARLPGLEFLEGRSGLRFGLCPASERDADLLSEAVEVAKEADFAIVFTGHEPFWETEGQDQVSFELPMAGSQNALVNAVTAVNPNTIVVNSTGVAIAMPWLENVAAVVQAWLGGQEVGDAIADVLLGEVNPEGHLPMTFMKSIEDSPAFGNFPGTNENHQPKVEYAEGVFVGYRHFDRLPRDKVNFPFGHGLSYTTFDYANLEVRQAAEENIIVSLDVHNTGERHGGTAVQVYVGYVQGDSAHPLKTLVAFEKVRLQPQEIQALTVSISQRDLGYFDEARGKWIVRSGDYQINIGRSAADIALYASLVIDVECVYSP